MKYKFLDKLSQNFSELFYDQEEYNVIIEVDKMPNKKTFTAHSVILRYRSSYFNKELSNNDDIIKTIPIPPSISAQVFEIILKYIYDGIIDTENLDTKTLFELMVAADELKFNELSKILESYLIEFKTSWLKTHFPFVYHSIFKNNKFENLKKCCNDIVARYPKLIFESTEFTSFGESVLVSILERDDLQMKESLIWDYLIKWGTAQNPTLPEKLERWTDENFMTLKSTLQKCLPLIRYFHISNPDVVDKIKPYKIILDKQLWTDLKQHLILPDRPVKSIIIPPRVYLPHELSSRVDELFSNIINQEQAAEISTWIDNEPTSYSLTNNPYEYRLILRGSNDGFAPRNFWDICHGYSNTIVVVKIKGTNEIVGGFNPLAWDKTKVGDVKTCRSFIFSFKDNSIRNSILSRVLNDKCALHYYRDKDEVGPRFGKAEFMLKSCESDFTKDCLNQCKKSKFYENSIRENHNYREFSITDYEVLKVVKNSRL
ncbi:hypothetical protein Glove_230g212 [Diversispora epigaea]|uniref:BTB domain-containing protein n=1 Tax=Diversispora epigaea TaxID=1348612 RepID=A0A397IH39_9GLOM|nr:hypothetical protein Glove_230g212 [Diversispora epigaea]